MSYRMLVKDVMDSMNEDSKLVNTTTDVEESELMRMTCKPIAVKSKKIIDSEYATEVFICVLVDFMRCTKFSYLGHTKGFRYFDERDFDVSIDHDTMLFTVELNVSNYKLTHKDLGLLAERPPIQCKNMKPGRIINKIINHIFDGVELPDDIRRRIEYKKNDIAKETSKLLKTNSTYYVYFTKRNYASHYLAMYKECNLRSCMSREAQTYGAYTENGSSIHPLEGYDYAPDFRLALFSEYSPEEIMTLSDDIYPFKRRQVTFLSDGALAYGKGYGSESLEHIACENFKLVTSTPNKRFYGIPAHRLDKDVIVEADVYALDILYDMVTNTDACAVVAPYIDPYYNAYDVGEVITRVDGVKVLQLITQDKKDDNRFYTDSETSILIYRDHFENNHVACLMGEKFIKRLV